MEKRRLKSVPYLSISIEQRGIILFRIVDIKTIKYRGNILPNGKSNILLKQNAEADGEYLTLGAASFAIIEG